MTVRRYCEKKDFHQPGPDEITPTTADEGDHIRRNFAQPLGQIFRVPRPISARPSSRPAWPAIKMAGISKDPCGSNHRQELPLFVRDVIHRNRTRMTPL